MMLVTVEQKVSKNRISALPNQLRKSLEKSATVKVINSFVIFYWLNFALRKKKNMERIFWPKYLFFVNDKLRL